VVVVGLARVRRKDMLGIVVGILLLIVGMILNDSWVIGSGIACMVVGALIEVANS
jgi:membrane protein implicated in regulation of membrane protease activity